MSMTISALKANVVVSFFENGQAAGPLDHFLTWAR